jgi:hypothetical protein
MPLRLPIALSLRKIRKPAYGPHVPVARMERSVIRDCREASTPPRIALRSIRATILVMPALVAGIHVFQVRTKAKTWMPGT